MAPRGVVRPYVDATVGVSYFVTTFSVRRRDDAVAYARDTNVDDAHFS